MLPSTPEFFCFLALIFFGYWLVWRVRLAGIALIILANYFFYAKWGFIYLALVPAASTIDFLIGRQLDRSQTQFTRRLLITGSVLLNVGLILVCKYIPFLFDSFAQITHQPVHTPSWTLPLGLSFYAFQSLTYTLDIYRRDIKPAKSYWTYLASVSFFPTTLAGPITRVATLLPQWEKPHRVMSAEEGGRALFLIGLGLMKKFLIADYLAVNLVNRVFDLPKLYSGGEVLVAVYAYAFQLYYDFSGYSDIAIGSALLLGIKLPVNFNRPYTAQNIADFWRRWHITLSNWLRDYLYFSLPGKRSKWLPYLNLVITMAAGGLWHGANWTFAIWGLLHGAGLAVVRLAQIIRGNKKPSAAWPLHALRVLVTFHFVAFTWIFFRAANLETAGDIIAQIASLNFAFDNVTGPFLMVFGIGIALHFTPKTWYQSLQELFSKSPALVQATAMVLLVIAIQYVGSTGAAPFIYTKF
jgi:D-alanyl-lipoteichoic acid acyltransferase DltB (MBOAT superfamily)